MPLHFRSLRSSSSGNCLLVWTDHTRVLIDCGLGSMKRTRQVLMDNLGDQLDIDALDQLDTSKIKKPFIVKPSVGFYSMGVFKVNSDEEWPEQLQSLGL